MAKKKSGIVKAAVGIGAVVVAGKVAYEKYKTTRSDYLHRYWCDCVIIIVKELIINMQA